MICAVPGIGRFEIDPPRLRLELAPQANEAALQTYLEGPIQAVWLHAKGALVLHGSGIAGSRGVVGFLGDSGAGKSTVAEAALRQGGSLWTDDLFAVIEGPRVLPGAPRIRLGRGRTKRAFPVSRTARAPRKIHRLLILERHPRQDWIVTPIEGADRVPAILRYVYTAPLDPRPSAAWHLRVLELAAAVPVARLTVPDRLDRLRRCWPDIWKAVLR